MTCIKLTYALPFSYKMIAPDHVKMHRIIDSESVIEFAASDLNGKPLKVDRAEDIEYKERSGNHRGELEWTY